jgi:hypothetical protein
MSILSFFLSLTHAHSLTHNSFLPSFLVVIDSREDVSHEPEKKGKPER